MAINGKRNEIPVNSKKHLKYREMGKPPKFEQEKKLSFHSSSKFSVNMLLKVATWTMGELGPNLVSRQPT